MNSTLFVTLLGTFSTITCICTEWCKKVLDNKGARYSSNVLAFIIACIVGCLGMSFYYVLNSIEFNIVNIVYMIAMGVATAAASMVGRDKVVQTIEQLKGNVK